MGKYLCATCKFNNNGWCKQRRMNGLKTILKCDDFRKVGTTLTFKRVGHDYYGQEMIWIQINDETVEVPFIVLENFLKDEKMEKQEVDIPD